ncbi:MAG: type B DNA-directed DNA polymerase [Methanoregula sp.]|jgi:DNA polymerase I|nr:type B DNA-directed DNA polymerase [Methanoregula sp.]
MTMWVLDTAYRNGVDLWCRDKSGAVTRTHHAYDPPFYLHLPDPAAHHEMIDVLAEHFRAEPCTFRTIFGELEGFSVHGDRRIAEQIEQQTQFEARFFNVDVRRDHRFMAEQGIFPCGDDPGSRFRPDFSYDLRQMEIRIHDNPARSQVCTDIELVGDRTERLQGPGGTVIEDFFGLVESTDPDVILMSDADIWLPKLKAFSQDKGFDLPFSRSGKYRSMGSRSYWSYGRMEHREAALIPDGRVLIDTDQSFVYREGGLAGVFMAARLSGLSPNMASRFTPGTLISSYEVYEAVTRGIVVPFRKADPETVRKLANLRAADRGGMMFQPVPGMYENVDELDFTSMYPSIIVKFNLSPETLDNPAQEGFLPAVLEPVISLRKETKKKKIADPRYAGIDTMLKWMLVTCFGYTGYKNAKFGRIEVHEAITGRSREILIQTKDLAESMGFVVLHGIVDCLWVQGAPVETLQERIGTETGLIAEVEHFNWIVFLPLNDGFGAYNRYYGRLSDGSVKVRGIAARRHDTPDYIRTMQQEMLEVMRTAKTAGELALVRDRVRQIYCTALRDLPHADPRTLAVSRRISRTRYAHRCLEGAAVNAYRDAGVEVAPGMKIRYIVRDAHRYQVDPEWSAGAFDIAYYRGLMEKAWDEIAYAFCRNGQGMNKRKTQKELYVPGTDPGPEPVCQD